MNTLEYEYELILNSFNRIPFDTHLIFIELSISISCPKNCRSNPHQRAPFLHRHLIILRHAHREFFHLYIGLQIHFLNFIEKIF